MFETDTTKEPETSRDISQAGTGLKKTQIKHNTEHLL